MATARIPQNLIPIPITCCSSCRVCIPGDGGGDVGGLFSPEVHTYRIPPAARVWIP